MQPHLNNHLLSSLSRQEFAALEPHLQLVEMPVRTVMEMPKKKVDQVYFMHSGIASVVAKGPHDREIEVALSAAME
jgi:hypothetical protein